ncbi:DUF6199 family natural product biosynthesis protein [Streptomyces sp. NPDC003011]
MWKADSPVQRWFVRDHDATEPTAKGHLLRRTSGAAFLVVAPCMLVQDLQGQ